jgi:hypothetical protein
MPMNRLNTDQRGTGKGLLLNKTKLLTGQECLAEKTKGRIITNPFPAEACLTGGGYAL